MTGITAQQKKKKRKEKKQRLKNDGRFRTWNAQQSNRRLNFFKTPLTKRRRKKLHLIT
jgi:hypothetical protein